MRSIRRKFRKLPVFVVLALCAVQVLCPASQPVEQSLQVQIEHISDRYFDTVHQELQKAEDSIWVAMYSIRIYRNKKSSPPYVLLQDLIDAHKRGVAVSVYLDRGYRYELGKDSSVLNEGNNLAYQILRESGIDVKFLAPTQILHAKLIVIDRRVVVEGSMNWSYWALMRNAESASLIRSEAYAATKIAWISKMAERATSLDDEPGDLPAENSTGDELWDERAENVLCVKESFLLQKELAPRMVTNKDQRAFDCYLLLLALQEKAQTNALQLVVDYDEMADGLGMDITMGRTAYRRQISKTLRKLQERYRLIECEFEYSGPAKVKLLDHSEQNKLYAIPEDSLLRIPKEYWDYGWSKKLSLTAKFMYLVSLYKQAISDMTPWWSNAQERLAEEFDVHKWSIGTGILELENMDIIQVERISPPDGLEFSDRAPNRYLLKKLRSPEEIESRWEQLESAYGKQTIKKAREFAGMITTENNQTCVEKIAGAIKEYGEERVYDACCIVSKKRRDNPYRNCEYMIGVLENMALTE